MTERTVRAKADGMAPNGSHVRQGAQFIIEDGEFAPSWMEPVGWTPPEPPKAETVADLLAAKDAQIAALAEQVNAEQGRVSEVVGKAQAAIEARDAQIAELKAALDAARAQPPEAPKPEPAAAKATTKTK